MGQALRPLRCVTVLLALLAACLALPKGPGPLAQEAAQPTEQPAAACWLAGSAVSVTLDPATQWQPRNGRVRLIARTSQEGLKGLDAKASVGFLPRDRTLAPGERALDEIPAEVVTESAKVNEVVYLVEMPELARPDSVATDFLWLIPLTRLSLRLTAPGDAACSQEYQVEIGITDPWFAAGGVAVFLLLLCIGGYFFRKRAGREETSLLLFPLETAERRASLSQFQILFWTLIVGCCAIYVMMLSGNLIEITSGTLILLGIVGGVSVLSAWRGERESNPAWAAPRQKLFVTAPADPAAQPAPRPLDLAVSGDLHVDLGSKDAFELCGKEWVRLEQVPPAQLKDVAPGLPEDHPAILRLRNYLRRPRWRHLIEAQPGEVDPARLQMLLFTAITGVFVALTVVRNYVIPEIPEGYLVLMGISNGVYLGGKFVKGS